MYIKTISEYQKTVLQEMKSKRLFLWTTGDTRIRAWLGDHKGDVVMILRGTTARAFIDMEAVKREDVKHPLGLVRYVINEKWDGWRRFFS